MRDEIADNQTPYDDYEGRQTNNGMMRDETNNNLINKSISALSKKSQLNQINEQDKSFQNLEGKKLVKKLMQEFKDIESKKKKYKRKLEDSQ